jgi:hypothetical protein
MVTVAPGCIVKRGNKENHSSPPERLFWAVVGDAEIAV